jgi:23S rRNA pseudouridine2604 synthase
MPGPSNRLEKPEGERLSKRVMALKNCSRSEAERYVEGGWVRVNGQVAEEPMFRVTDQRVEVDAHASLLAPISVTLLLNKPPGLDAMAAPGVRGLQSAQTLLHAGTHFVPESGHLRGPGNILKRHFNGLTACVPLEPAASGLVVFTQDWRVARKLIEDAALIEHELMVEVAGAVSPEALHKLNHSGKRDDEALPPVKASVGSTSDVATRLRFAVKGAHPGLIAWLCERAGLQILGMKRIRIGRVGLGQVPVGQWRYMAAHERF